MKNPPLKAFGRKLAEFAPLKPAEKILLDACRCGHEAIISKHRPENATKQNTVCASFLRFLALGGDEQAPVHEKGVLLSGAWVEGDLDLDGAALPHNLNLHQCRLSKINLDYSKIKGSVDFPGCHVLGFKADGMRCTGNVVLNNDFTSTGTVSFINAQIEGNLECGKAKFNPAGDEYALICAGAVINGGVFLENCSTFGTVNLLGARIGANLEFQKASLDSSNNTALLMDDMTVAGTLHFHDLQSVKGIISLASAKVGRLNDDVKSWMSSGLTLDGFVYDSLSGEAPTDAKSRLAWLNKQSDPHAGKKGDGKEFKSQPWQQLHKVLREMGHVEDARQVAIAFEDQLHDANLITRIFHWLFGFFIGYGYRPLRLVTIMLIVWFACGMFYWLAALYGNNGNGVFAPSNPLVFQNPEYATCVPDSCAAKVEKIKSDYAALHEKLPSILPYNQMMFQNSEYAVCVPDSDTAKTEKTKPSNAVPPVQGAGNWYLCAKLREEYTGFSPLAYSLDLILPLVDLQQEHDWSPMIPTPQSAWYVELYAHSLNHVTRLVMWFEILFGWMTSLLLVAVVSGLTKRREE